ncbi:MAG: serine/threonine protein kinase [Myxococcaceae bacterium]
MQPTLADKPPENTGPRDFGPYQLIRRIGAGGMGEVYLAREKRAGGARACVVKKVLPSLIENRAFVGRFLDEAKVVTRLNHPNIASVYSMGEVEGQYYLAMEYVQGKTVSRFMHRLRTKRQVLPPGLILLIGERMCEGLAYAHDATDEHGAPLHLVHRDLSPANVCISYGGEVKIIDFGAAQSTLKEEKTAPRVVIGNLTYMSPEQARKQFVDRRADVYSTGVVLWELLAWHPLPQKGDPIERWRKAASPVWEPPSFHRPALPTSVNDVILKALRKDANERYPDAKALGDELKRLRRDFFPGVDDSALSTMLTEAFAKEKQSEDEILANLEKGSPVGEVPTDKTNRPTYVPPTALAFEHSALHGPEDFVPEQPVERVTEPGGPAAIESRRTVTEADVQESRVAFGTNTENVPQSIQSPEVSLVLEIEGSTSGEDADADYDTNSYDLPPDEGASRMLWIGAALFFVALIAGFVVVLLLGAG